MLLRERRVDSLLLVLVSVLGTALAGTGAHAWLNKDLNKDRLTRTEHDDICKPRVELIQKDIGHMQTDIGEIKEDVAFLVKKNGGRE